MTRLKVAAFGEAEKGQYAYPYTVKNLSELVESLGNPPKDSQGLLYAIQALLYERDLIFFRVEEEGFHIPSYVKGLKILENPKVDHVDALCLPGVGDQEILEATKKVCRLYQSIMILTEKDLYDYLTHQN